MKVFVTHLQKRLQDELRELEASHEDERQQLQRSHDGLSNAELKQAVELKRLEEVQQEELEELRKQVQPAIEQRDNAIAQQAELQAEVAGLERQVALIHQEHEGELEVVCDSHDELIDKLQVCADAARCVKGIAASIASPGGVYCNCPVQLRIVVVIVLQAVYVQLCI